MKTIIYLTRHGQTEWNLERRLQGRGNSPLTKAGIERAKELRDRIK
ncbi:histidine phosphatase family protein, partial [Clostridium saudiense]|nr:histidine phosphatase family protein [Clostridium saudiense]